MSNFMTELRKAKQGLLPFGELLDLRRTAPAQGNIESELWLIRATEEDHDALASRVLSLTSDADLATALAFLLSISNADDVWHVLFQLVERDPTLLSQIEPALDQTWDDSQRPMPRTWWDRMLKGEDQDYFRLARALSFFEGDIDHDGLLVALPYLRHLTGFQLCGTDLGDDAYIALAQAGSVSNLKHLIIGASKIGEQGVHALANSPTLANLEILDLNRNNLGGTCVGTLINSVALHRLRQLDLSNTNVDEPAAAALMSESNLRSLEKLNLSYCNFDLAKLARHWSEMQARTKAFDLSLRRNFTDPDAVVPSPSDWQAFFSSPQLQSLSGLDIIWCNLGLEGARHLGSCPYLKNIKSLEFRSDAPIGREGAEAICSADWFKTLTLVDFFGEKIGDDAAECLRALDGGAVQHLVLLHNDLAEQTCRVLGEIDLPNLERLEMSYNTLGDDGCAALFSNRSLGKLEHAELISVGVSDRTFDAIARNENLCELRFLDLYGSTASLEAARRLAKASHLASLENFRPGGEFTAIREILLASPHFQNCYIY